jgi:Cu-Zn family superoxide dismutase
VPLVQVSKATVDSARPSSKNLLSRSSGLAAPRQCRVSLGEGPKSLFDSDGSAPVIHADQDDQVTDPTGNRTALTAAGVIA